MAYLSIFSTVITFIFAVAVFVRYARKKRIYLLLWGVGLVFYGLGTLMEALLLFQFNGGALKLWYLSGAMLTAAWLGQGTINLLVRKRGVAPALNLFLLLISLVALAVVLAAPLTAAASTYNITRPASEQYQAILTRSGLMIFLTIFLNIYGTLALVGGALYSAYLFWRKQVLLNRVFGNLLIAGGALLPAMAGSFVKAGLVDWLYLSELLGSIVMFLGFLMATAPQTAPASSTQPV